MGSEEGSTMRSFIVCTIFQCIRMIKSERLRWVGHEARIEEGKVLSKL